MIRSNIFLIAALACAGTSAFAQKAGSWSASVGLTHIAPDVTSGNLSAPSLPGTQVDVNSNTQLTGALNYAWSDNLVLSAPLGLGFKHKITGAGAIAGVGTLLNTKALPVTLIGQYRFGASNAAIRPYLGAGLTYAKFFDTQGTAVLTAITNPGGPATTAKFQSKLVPTIQLGAVFDINEKWYLDANYTKTFLTTTGTLSTGQVIRVKLNPDGISLGVGYKF